MEDSKKLTLELITLMLQMWDDTTVNDVEGFCKCLEDGKVSYLAEVLKSTLSSKELCVVDAMSAPLLQHFKDTGIKVTEMVTMMHVHLAI